MIDSQIVAFTFAAAVLTVTPGQDTMLVVRNVLRGGRGAGVSTTLGICAGLFMHATLSALGVSVLLMHSATAFHLVKFAGACYLVWLARAIAVQCHAWGTPSRRPRAPARPRCRLPPALLSRGCAQQCAESEDGGVLPGLSATVHRPDRPGAAEVPLASGYRLCRGHCVARRGIHGGGSDAPASPASQGPEMAGRHMWDVVHRLWSTPCTPTSVVCGHLVLFDLQTRQKPACCSLTCGYTLFGRVGT